MWTPTAKRVLCWLGLLLVSGCCSSVRDETNEVVCEQPEQPVETITPASKPTSTPAAVPVRISASKPSTAESPAVRNEQKTDPNLKLVSILMPPAPLTLMPPLTPPKELPIAGPTPPAPRVNLPAPPGAAPPLLPARVGPLLLTAQPVKPKESSRDRLKIPEALPGARVPPLELPPPDPAKRKEREEAIRRLFPDLPKLDTDPSPVPGPNGEPLTLSDLQRLALSNNPILQQATFDVDAARGVALQVGLWPNPTVGFQGDTINTDRTAGYLGFFLSQLIRTAGKPQLARAAALIDVLNAELARRRTESDLIAKVRGSYFAVLVARENLKVSRALAEFADEVYHLQVELLKAAQAPAYEPLQLRVLSTQARAGLLQARNRYRAAWTQLASNLGLADMPPTEVAGAADMPAPQYDRQVVLEHVLKAHTDVGTALNAVQKAQIDLKLARVTPIPDVSVSFAVQHDYTSTPNDNTFNVLLGVPIPVFDRNQGAIRAAEAALMKADQESARVRNDLTARVAEAFERYDNNRRILAYYQTGILPDQVRAYRALYLRYHREPDQVNLQDVVNAQQILAQSVTTYITTLNALWTAVADVSNLLQTDELWEDWGAK